MKLEEIVKNYYKNLQQDTLAVNQRFMHALREEVINTKGEYPHYDDDPEYKHLAKFIFKQYELFMEELMQNKNAHFSLFPSAASMRKNLWNWTDCWNRTVKPSRKNILLVSLVLGLDDKQCNALLRTVGEQMLHAGGDASESIVCFCLKAGRDMACAKKMFDIFSAIPEEVEQGEKLVSANITEEARKRLNLTMLAKGQEATNESIPEKVAMYIDAKHSELPKNEQVLLGRLYVERKQFAEISRKTYIWINKMLSQEKQEDEKTGFSGKFISFYDVPHMGRLDNVLIDCRKGYRKAFKQENTNLKTKPTRSFIILMAIVAWCNNLLRKDLCDYVDEVLGSCGFGLLDKGLPVDNFVIELSQYEWDETKKYICYCGERVTELNLIDQTRSTKYETYQDIVAAYLEEQEHILANCKWTDNNIFFSF